MDDLKKKEIMDDIKIIYKNLGALVNDTRTMRNFRKEIDHIVCKVYEIEQMIEAE